MKRQFSIVLTIFSIVTFATIPAFSDEADALNGKWTLKKANDQGQTLTRDLEFKKSKFTFSMLGSDDKVVFYAEGDIKLEKLGPFASIKFTNMKIGASASDVQPFDEDRTSIYRLGEGTLTLASDFDGDRDQKPSLDVYKQVAATVGGTPMTLIIDKIVMHQTPQAARWFVCFDAKVEGAVQRFHIPKKEFDKDGVTIQMDLKLPNVRPGQTCTFRCQLDDIDDDVCTDDIDNTSSGKFTVSERGLQEYKPEDRWRYTVYWHLK